jgi:hypothetical protein
MLVAALVVALAAGPAPAFAERADPKWYQVRAGYQGQPEFLYEIAQRFLGDGERFPEIVALNKGREQADGLALTNPEEIEPGWILLLPADAKGDGVQTGPIPVPSSAPASAPTALLTTAPATGKPFPVALISVVGGVLIVAGAGALALRRRRPRSFQDPATTLTAAADWTIDRALRAMAESVKALPPVRGVSLDDSRLRLRLDTPDFGAVEPWKVTEEGRVWVASLPDLQAQPAAGDTPSPYPRLITLGTTGGTRELLNLGRSTGVISIGGDDVVAREVVAGWTEELVSSPWSSRVRVVTGGFAIEVKGDQLTVLNDVPAALDLVATLPGELGVVILGGVPDGLAHLGSGWTAIVLGETGHDHWHFTAHPGGRLDTGALGITVTAPPAKAAVSW